MVEVFAGILCLASRGLSVTYWYGMYLEEKSGYARCFEYTCKPVVRDFESLETCLVAQQTGSIVDERRG